MGLTNLIGAMICSMKFLSLEVVLDSCKIYDLVLLGILLDSLGWCAQLLLLLLWRQTCRTVVPLLAAFLGPLAHHQNVEMLPV